ncbi:MAG: carboxypeptidase-like regulatory domain-containing protein [Bacteroidales bacterium]|nr:carboxypeptidase-like regulatory domain-containing protein [Bacteroidales bacterium]
MKLKLLFLISFIILIQPLWSQETKVKGLVLDATTNEPVPFANIAFKGTNVGTISSMEGQFSISTRQKVDTLIVSFIGYKTQKLKVKSGVYQSFTIALESENISLDEVVVVPGENPAFEILRRINKHKKENNPDKVDRYNCKVYNKMQVDLNNISENFQKQKLLKKFDFVFDYIDTSVVTGKNYLPVLISETYSDFYYRKIPTAQKELILANQVSGIDNKSISQYTGQMYQKINIYDNYVSILDRSFVSPISGVGRAYYKYYLLDSAFVGNNWSYKISFVPRFKHEPVFDGFFWVADTSYAIKTIEMNLSKDANLNLVQHFYLKQDFEQVNEDTWMKTGEKMVMDFNVAEKTMGFFSRKTTHFSDYIIGNQISDTIFSALNSRMTVVADTADKVNQQQWNTLRNEELNENELGIYQMVDSIKNVPIFRTYIDIARAIFSGFYEIDKIELGDYTSLYSYNVVEGNRFKLMARSSTNFSEKLFLDGYLAYGTKDERFKYGGGFRYYFNRDLTRSFGVKYQKDVEQLGISPYSLASDNFLNSLFSRTGAVDLLTNKEEISTFIKYEWFSGFTNTISFSHRYLSPQEEQGLDFRPKEDSYGPNEIIVSEVSLKTRIAFNERTILGREEKVFLTSKYPVITLNFTVAPKGAINSTYNYQRLQVGWLQLVKTNPIGYFKYYFEAGKIFGTLPYPLLEMHKGNETYWYDDYAFNLMNYYEFVSDEWYSLLFTHHFEGFFLNKIPLIKELKWREVLTLKGVVGNMTEENKNYSNFPTSVQEVNTPYVEASLGIENIFTIFRVDALWRLTHLDQPNISKFGIRMKVQFEF